jgi:tRNA 2-thiouridine synthesizing protein A
VFQHRKRCESGRKILKVEADDPAAEEDITRWAKRTGHKILQVKKEGALLTFYIKRMK